MFLRRFAAERLNVFPPMTLLATGLALICCSLVWPRVTILHGTMSSSAVDFIQGVLLGIAIACLIMGIGGMWGGRPSKSDSSHISPD